MRKEWVLLPRRWLFVLTLGGLCGLSACLIAPPEDTGAGSVSAPISGRSYLTATLLANGQVLVVGGSRKSVSLTSVQLYDPKTRVWRETGSLLEGRGGHTSLLLPSGKVLVLGGFSTNPENPLLSPLHSMELYEPVSGRWSSLTPAPEVRSLHQVTLLRDGRILVTGGYGKPKMLASVMAYDPETDQWSVRASMSQPRAEHTATLLPDGRVLVVGGQQTPSERDSAEIYDPATDTWSNTSALHSRHPYAVSQLRHDGQVLIICGAGPVAGNELYDPARGTWTAVPFRPVSMSLNSFPTRMLLPDGRILFAAGSGSESTLRTVRLYHSETYEWSSASPLPEPRSGHADVLLPDGRVLLVGGRRSELEPAAPVVTYDPRTDTWE